MEGNKTKAYTKKVKIFGVLNIYLLKAANSQKRYRHSHIAVEILLYTTTRRKIPNIWGNWHMKFNSPLLRLSCMMLNNGELKSCSINSPLWGIENFRCNIGMSILHQGVKEIGQIPHLSLVASHSWLMGNLFFTTSHVHLWLRHYVVKNPIPFSPR